MPEDAPPDHPCHKEMKWEPNHAVIYFKFGPNKLRFQTTVGKAGSRESAEWIGRACWMKFEAGCSKEEVIIFRQQCYDQVAPIVDAAKAGLVKEEHQESKKRPHKTRNDDEGGPDHAAKKAKKNKVKHQKSSEVKPAQQSEAPAPGGEGQDVLPDDGDVDAPGGEGQDVLPDDGDFDALGGEGQDVLPDDGDADDGVGSDDDGDDSLSTSSRSSSSSSGSSSGDKREQDVPERKQPVITAHATHWPPTKNLGTLGLVAAKMSVRTGLRCWCCYSNVCSNLKT